MLLTKNHPYWITEVISYGFLPLTIVLCFRFFARDQKRFEKIILNAYYIINSIVTIIQFYQPGFLIRNFSNNNFYTDQICGLLGTNGTHRLSFLTLACLLLNYCYFYHQNKKTRMTARVMMVFIIISSIYVSAFNDNRMYYFLLVFFLIPMILNDLWKKEDKKIKINKKKMKMLLLGACIMLTAGIALYVGNEKVHTFVNEKIIEEHILRTKENITGSITDTGKVTEERIELLKYALEYGNGLYIGKGIGSIRLFDEPSAPKHFGLNEMTSRVYNGGLIYVFILIYLYTTFYRYYFKNLSKFHVFFIAICLLIFSIYARIFTMYDETFLISLLFIFYTYAFTRKKKNQ